MFGRAVGEPTGARARTRTVNLGIKSLPRGSGASSAGRPMGAGLNRVRPGRSGPTVVKTVVGRAAALPSQLSGA
jgi:hypothetical protein